MSTSSVEAKNCQFICVKAASVTPEIPKAVTSFTNQVDRVFRGLGRPVFYNLLSEIANKSVFIIGDRGTGKTRTIVETPVLDGCIGKNWFSFTYEELGNFCFANFEEEGQTELKGKNLVFKVPELSSFSEYHREILLTVISTIITDKSYEHRTKHSPFLSLKDCRLTCLIAIQPFLYSTLCSRFEQWESMSYDRFTKFLLLNPIRNSSIDDDVVLNLKFPKFAPLQNISLSANLNLDCVNNLLREQLSKGRSKIYASDYLKAYANFKGQTQVTQDDVREFHYLFRPYLDSFNRLQFSRDFESFKVVVSTGTLKVLTAIASFSLHGVQKKTLVSQLKCTDKMVEDTTSFLAKIGLISKTEDEHGVGKPVTYKLSEDLIDYFKTYDEAIQ